MKGDELFGGNRNTSVAKDLARTATEASKPAATASATPATPPATKSDSELAARAMDIRPKRTF